MIGRYDNTLPKFRYTGTAQSGGDHGIGGIPVVWDTEKFNVDAVVNGGVFLCMRPGFYYFSAALSAHARDKSIGVHIAHNSINGVYARHLSIAIIFVIVSMEFHKTF